VTPKTPTEKCPVNRVVEVVTLPVDGIKFQWVRGYLGPYWTDVNEGADEMALRLSLPLPRTKFGRFLLNQRLI
jgi:hypothetical protein